MDAIAHGGLERVWRVDADIEAETNYGNAPLNFATESPRCTQFVERLLAHQRSRHGAAGVGSLLLKTGAVTGRNALHQCATYYGDTSERSQFLVEHCRGKDDGILLAACHQIMIAKDSEGDTPLDLAKRNSKSEVVEYLESFTTLPLAAAPDNCGLAVMLNPKLDDFQRAIATDCLDLIRACCLDVIPECT